MRMSEEPDGMARTPGLARAVRRRCGLWAAAATLLLGAWAAAAEEAGPRLPVVTVAPVTLAEIVGRAPVSGTTVPRREILIYPRVSGYSVETVEVDIGDTVAAGEILATLDDSRLAAQLAQAEAEFTRAKAGERQARSQIASAEAALAQAEAAQARSDRLRARDNISQASADQATADAEMARAALDSATSGLAIAEAQTRRTAAELDVARLNLDNAKIRAPWDGVVSARTARVGAISASGGEPLFTIIANGEIEVEAEVIETTLGRIEPGDETELMIAGRGAATGTVRLISPAVDPVDRLGVIRIAVAGGAVDKTGLFAGGWIITDRRISPSVPAAAVLTDLEGDHVLVVVDGVIERRKVAAGLIWDGRREILSGLEVGEVVVARAGAFFRDGDRIRPVRATDAAE